MAPQLIRLLGRGFALPRHWWARQSLRARLTLVATAVFAIAVITGAVLLLVLQRYALTRVLDQSAQKTGRDIGRQVSNHNLPSTVQPTTGGITAVQVVDVNNAVLAATQGADHVTSLLTRAQLRQVRDGDKIEIESANSSTRLRVLGRDIGTKTVVVFTDVSRVDDSLRILTSAALIGSPLAVLLLGTITYFVVALTLRPVAALRHGAADITAAGLREQRLPVPGAKDEIHRLAITLNAMLDRIDSATSRQRTFVGDAAHEFRSPLASLRAQLEIAQRLGPESDWNALIDDVLVDVARLDRLVEALLTLARLDEAGSAIRGEWVDVGALAETVVAGYGHARVPVRIAAADQVGTYGDPDALRRIAINLIDNAVRHARHEVTVSVEAGTRSDKAVCVLTVVDDGPGVPEAERQRVFDRFYRLHASRSRETGGTGLGLPIVRDIVRNHGGRVRLTDRTDGRPGLRAVVVLPVPDDPGSTIRPGPA